MRKGIQIKQVDISSDGKISATDTRCKNFALTRRQRSILSQYTSDDYVEDIIREFQNPNILAEDYTVTCDGVTVYTYTK